MSCSRFIPLLPTPFGLTPKSMFSFFNFTTFLLIATTGIHTPNPPSEVSAHYHANATNQSEPVKIQFGIDGFTKLGNWVPVFIESQQHREATHFEITVLDGDDQPIKYSGELIQRENKPGLYEAWMRTGRQHGTVTVCLLDSQQQKLAERTLNVDDTPNLKIIPSTNQLILSIEPERTVLDSLQTTISGKENSEKQIILAMNDVQWLPSSWLGMQSISTIVISTSDTQLIQSLSKQQWKAMDQWVRNGGQLIFCGGQNGEAVFKEDGLGQFLPGPMVKTIELENSWQLEAFANSRDQLLQGEGQTLPATVIKPTSGIVDKTQDETPLIIRTARGFGIVVFSAVDFDQGPIVDWAGRNSFITGLLDTASNLDPSTIEESQSNQFSHFGYDDLIGQLKVPLEQFSKVRFVTFTWVAVLIGLYILCIGPGDYFLLRNVFGKMELTWVTFTLITLAFCGIALMMAQLTRPNRLQINQLEIIDIDAIDNTARGNLWANIYSPTTNDCQADTGDKNTLGFDTRTDSTIIWQGLPGNGLGGMQTRVGAQLFQREYQCAFEASGEGSSPARCSLTHLPLQVSSTKPLFVQWYSPTPFKVQSRLKVDPRIQRLEGTITNPLNVDIRNCRLMFENWTYKLDGILEPGETFDVATETREQTAKNFLTRRVRESNKGKNVPWDRADSRLWRIADILMFYELAGGRGYTKLSHDYQSQVDLSRQLNLGRAMLVGEIQKNKHCTEVKISGPEAEPNYDNVTTIVRIVLPVEYEKSDK